MSEQDEHAVPGLSRLREIGEKDPTAVFSQQIMIIVDECVAQTIRNHQQGKGRGKALRAIGFTKTADALNL